MEERDIIIIDMPPGTGDTQLTFAQEVKVDGAIIVFNSAGFGAVGCKKRNSNV